MASPVEGERRGFEEEEEEDELWWFEFQEVQREMARFGLREEAEGERRRHDDAEPRLVLEHGSLRRYAEQMMIPGAGDMVQEGVLPQPFSPPLGMLANRCLLDEWRFRGDHITWDNYFAAAPHNFQVGASYVPRHAATWPGVFPSDAYVAPPPACPRRAAVRNWQVEDYISYLAKNERMVLDTLLWGSPEDHEAVANVLVRYAVPLMESGHGRRLLGSVLHNCGHGRLQDSILARITRDKKSFSKICIERPDEVVTMIKSCRSLKPFHLLSNAILPWMAPLMIQSLDPNRLEVVQAFVQSVSPDFAKFIFDAVAKNCLTLACRQKGVCLLENCLEHFNGTEKDKILSEISYGSIDLARNRHGNYIIQDVLKQRDPLHLAIIASCFRKNYVKLSRQRYSSNVVETCLEVFGDVDRSVIVVELIYYPHFRDLVIDPFANYVISKALKTCKVPLRHRLAIAILSLQNVNYRHPHCLRIFSKLSELGYIP